MQNLFIKCVVGRCFALNKSFDFFGTEQDDKYLAVIKFNAS